MGQVFNIGDKLYQVLINWHNRQFEVKTVEVLEVTIEEENIKLHCVCAGRNFNVYAKHLDRIYCFKFCNGKVFTTRELAYNYLEACIDRVMRIAYKELRHEWINVAVVKPMENAEKNPDDHARYLNKIHALSWRY